MDFIKPVPLGAHASLAASTPVRRPVDASRVEMPSGSGKTRADMQNAKEHGAEEAERDIAALRRDRSERLDPEQPVGPPPSFQVNVLEMERELQQQLAQIEATRQTSATASITEPKQEAEPENAGTQTQSDPAEAALSRKIASSHPLPETH